MANCRRNRSSCANSPLCSRTDCGGGFSAGRGGIKVRRQVGGIILIIMEVVWDGNRLAYPHRAGFRSVSDECHSRICAVHVTGSPPPYTVHVTVSCQICGVMSDLRGVMSDGLRGGLFGRTRGNHPGGGMNHPHHHGGGVSFSNAHLIENVTP